MTELPAVGSSIVDFLASKRRRLRALALAPPVTEPLAQFGRDALGRGSGCRPSSPRPSWPSSAAACGPPSSTWPRSGRPPSSHGDRHRRPGHRADPGQRPRDRVGSRRCLRSAPSAATDPTTSNLRRSGHPAAGGLRRAQMPPPWGGGMLELIEQRTFPGMAMPNPRGPPGTGRTMLWMRLRDDGVHDVGSACGAGRPAPAASARRSASRHSAPASTTASAPPACPIPLQRLGADGHHRRGGRRPGRAALRAHVRRPGPAACCLPASRPGCGGRRVPDVG